MLRVAIIGPAQSGKTTGCGFLIDEFGGKIESFANPLKHEVFGFLVQYRLRGHEPNWRGQNHKILHEGPNLATISLPGMINPDPIQWINKHKPEVRAFMQWYGTDFRRKDNENYWIDKMSKCLQGTDNIFVDDCRFVNEAELLLDKGFALLAIKPVNMPNIAESNHESETTYEEIIRKFDVPLVVNKYGEMDAFRQALIKASKPFLIPEI